FLDLADLEEMPGVSGMIDERLAQRAHAALPLLVPDADAVAREAGRGTADYVMARRIPGLAKAVLRLLPGPVAAPILARAIARNAWTFAGSGRFDVHKGPPLTLVIGSNPLAGADGCHWHSAVFERMFRVLADDRLRVTETACCRKGAPACRFEVSRVS
ncbi:MAG: bacteriochlorophyll 4-vinyl reductase, partial [Rubricella sp.]